MKQLTIFTVLSKNAIVPRDTPFWREYKEGEKTRFSVVVSTDPLVRDLPNPTRSSVPRLRRCDIGSTYFCDHVNQYGALMPTPRYPGGVAMQGGSKSL
jgi:hypothetical protein